MNIFDEFTSDEREVAVETLKAFSDWRDGKPIQYCDRVSGCWKDVGPRFQLHLHHLIRRKPEPPKPKLRAWTQKDVPLLALFRYRAAPAAIAAILACEDGAFRTFWHRYNFAEVFDDCSYEHSVDKGKTWHRCGVVEAEVRFPQ